MFDSLTIPEARPIVWLKRVFLVVIVVLLAIGMVSSHRAYFQVRSLELKAPHTLAPGSSIEAAVVSSGRTTVDVDVDLIQGTHSERLFTYRLRGNELGFFDPRTKNASRNIILTSDFLAKFQPGAARLRSVATGREQWTRLPPPTVRELEVELVVH
ncbi:MAG TPA: hypothetical protein VHS05_18835 [Pyrinomonadaceae bacterium]|jgi:hypothetical protein|nr:hypothetical protein [Pyrinomonadaceae bacterium]